ncbi:hypothetical protein [Streptomyces sp. AC495_CC817]|uniref:hypothetical protein n=1 Tax=Streptomyces sp. AC495_CC817 TaxID=2823900 RepID=UPI001C278C49|nr:hypothetical protein [Streptomyces sp. AC495_CC817]
MAGRRTRAGAAPILVAASSYALNCALGTAVALRIVDTRDVRWVHHLLYVCTCVTTGVAVVLGAARPRSRAAALSLAPAAVPLAAIPYAGTRTRRHPLVALAAAPFYLAAVVGALRLLDRK